jgi:hypothetical protein
LKKGKCLDYRSDATKHRSQGIEKGDDIAEWWKIGEMHSTTFDIDKPQTPGRGKIVNNAKDVGPSRLPTECWNSVA